MTKTDIDNIIEIICPNDEDFEKPCISPAYLKKELEILALEQEPCEDCISRQAVIELVEGWWIGHTKEDDLATEIKSLPSVTPQPKVGEWLKNGELCKCSNCHSNVLFSAIKLYNYCYHCGAKMV